MMQYLYGKKNDYHSLDNDSKFLIISMLIISSGIVCVVLFFIENFVNYFTDSSLTFIWGGFFTVFFCWLTFPSLNQIDDEKDFNFNQNNDYMSQKDEDIETLELTGNPSPIEIKKAFRRMAMKYHPDRNNATNAHEHFYSIKTAYERLMK